jgi:holdfast attachment protein HfaA
MHRALLTSTFAAAGLLAVATSASAADIAARQSATAASQGLSNSAAYNGGFGLGSGGENQAASGKVRDGSNNLMIVNGVMAGAGAGASARASAGVSIQDGIGGTAIGSGATAIGNNLNVTVIGNWNTTIVDSTQINNGDQNANVSLNGQLKL